MFVWSGSSFAVGLIVGVSAFFILYLAVNMMGDGIEEDDDEDEDGPW